MKFQSIDLSDIDADNVEICDDESSGGVYLKRGDDRCYGCGTPWHLDLHWFPPGIVLPYLCGWRPGIKSSECGVTRTWKKD